MTTKVSIYYENSDVSVDIFVDGPHAASGIVLDALLNLHNVQANVSSINVTPNPTDIPEYMQSIVDTASA